MSKSWGEIREEALRRCGQLPPQTNADKLRSMSDEELANWITDLDHDNPCPPDNSCSCHTSNCMKGWLDWLRQEVSDGDS